MKRLVCSSVIALAGCPAMTASPPAPIAPALPTAAPQAVGCPPASQVHVASFLTRADPAPTAPTAPDAPASRSGWVMPLHDRKVPTVENRPSYENIEPSKAVSLGVPAAPPTLWLMAAGQPPCKATVAGYYAATVDAPDPNVTYGVELDGCPVPPPDQQDDAEAIVLATEQAPGDCRIVAPQQVAARLGTTDAAKQWHRPTTETPIPPGLAAVIPPHDCRAPGCETLWTIAQVSVANAPVAWAGAVNWLAIPPDATPASQCAWKAETFAGFFVVGSDGRAVKITEGQRHPLLMSAVLADRTGARVLVAEGPGEYATYDLAGGKASLGRQLVWLELTPEAYAVDERIGPSCGGDGSP